MIENIKDAIYQSIGELFVNAAMDEMTGDYVSYKEKLKIIANIAELLGIDTEIISVSINIKTGKTIIDIETPPKDSSETSNLPGIVVASK